jgi:ABC-type transporter MlaC component
MKSLVAGSFYNRRKVLLDNNSTYPNFLIEHYKGSSVEIEKSITDTNQGTAAVTVTVNFPENKKDRYRYILKKYQNGHWKIVRQDQR